MLNPQELTKLKEQGYEVEVPSTPFSTDYTLKHIRVPQKKNDAPKIIGWAGPARSGTTSLLFLLAGHQTITKAYFQPLKTILRQGGPDLVLPKKSVVCIKEVFRGCCIVNKHDPIHMLLRAGIPPENIAWIAMLRDPIQNYASWTHHIVGSTPEDYAAAQTYTVDLYHNYKKQGFNITPFAYDLLEGREPQVLGTLLKKVGLAPLDRELAFNKRSITRKISYGQASDPNYFKMSIKPTLERKKLVYTPSSAKLSSATAKQINELCRKRYEEFYELSKSELGIR